MDKKTQEDLIRMAKIATTHADYDRSRIEIASIITRLENAWKNKKVATQLELHAVAGKCRILLDETCGTCPNATSPETQKGTLRYCKEQVLKWIKAESKAIGFNPNSANVKFVYIKKSA